MFLRRLNPAMVPQGQAPKTYQDLSTPSGKEKMAWNPGSMAGAIGFCRQHAIGRGGARNAYLEALSAADVNIEVLGAILDQVLLRLSDGPDDVNITRAQRDWPSLPIGSSWSRCR